MYTKVLVPLDQSELAETILPHATEVARRFDAELILLNVVPGLNEMLRAAGPVTPSMVTPIPSDPQFVQQSIDAAVESGQHYLDELVARLKGQGLNVRSVLAQGPTARTILQVAGDESVSLIAMCTHGHSGLARTFLGSVADEVVRESQRPVLLLRPPSAD
jgi:nucleotide-binding universal stress UspA family protein